MSTVNVTQSFLQTEDNKVIEFARFKNFTFNNLIDLTRLILLFILILFYTVSKIGMYGLLCILTLVPKMAIRFSAEMKIETKN